MYYSFPEGVTTEMFHILSFEICICTAFLLGRAVAAVPSQLVLLGGRGVRLRVSLRPATETEIQGAAAAGSAETAVPAGETPGAETTYKPTTGRAGM